MTSLANKRILVVDDDPDITRLLRAYLEQSGFAVLSAANVAASDGRVGTAFTITLPLA
jgi:DNA-binding response OmpR family regulator